MNASANFPWMRELMQYWQMQPISYPDDAIVMRMLRTTASSSRSLPMPIYILFVAAQFPTRNTQNGRCTFFYFRDKAALYWCNKTVSGNDIRVSATLPNPGEWYNYPALTSFGGYHELLLGVLTRNVHLPLGKVNSPSTWPPIITILSPPYEDRGKWGVIVINNSALWNLVKDPLIEVLDDITT